jgi:asparagine synthetase B (glutamine-hydrolysing)
MSIIFGVVSKGAQDIEDNWSQLMLQACQTWQKDDQKTTLYENVLLGCLKQYNTPQNPLVRQPCNNAQYHLVFDGRLDNHQELANKLDLILTEQTTDEALLLAAFARYQT